MNIQTSLYPGRWYLMNGVLCLGSHSLYPCFPAELGIKKQTNKPKQTKTPQKQKQTRYKTKQKKKANKTNQIKFTRSLRKKQRAAEKKLRLSSLLSRLLGSKGKVSNPDQKHRETNALQRRSVFRRLQPNTAAGGVLHTYTNFYLNNCFS